METKGALKATQEAPQTVTINLDTSKGDLGDIAKAVGACDTPHKAKVAPAVMLILDAPGLSAGNAGKVADALKDVKGVEAKDSKADAKKKEIMVQLDPKGGAKLADIKKALADFTK